MMTLDWKRDLNKILQAIKTHHVPFKITSFFPVKNSLPQSNEDFVSRYPNIPITINRSNQQERIAAIRNGNFEGVSKETVGLKEFYLRSQIDSEFKKNVKCYEDLIPREFVEDLAKSLDIQTLFPFADNDFLPDFYYRFFYGFKGDQTELHFDWSPFTNILLQVYGDKEIRLIPPATFGSLPIFHNYIEQDLHQVLPQEDGIILRHGEGLIIPPYYGHGVKYLNDSTSLSLRLLPSQKGSQLHRRLPANFGLARILDFSKSENLGPDLYRDLLNRQNYVEILSIYQSTYQNLFSEPFILSAEAIEYEKHLFQRNQSFEGILWEKKRKSDLIQRGNAFFSHL